MGVIKRMTAKGKKSQGSKGSNVEPKSKGKLPMFGGKKKDMTLIERMQLEESVAAASLEVVQELADSREGAVREIEDGLLIVVFTNEDLTNAGLSADDEEFGSFAEALRSETINSIALAKDLEDGIIGVIPSPETLLSMDEFDFVAELEFKWALVPFDLDDSDQLILLDDTVHLSRLMELSKDPEIELVVQNGSVVEVEVEGEELDDLPDVGFPPPEMDDELSSEEEDPSMDDEFDETMDDDDADDDDLDDLDDAPTYYPMDDESDDELDDDNVFSIDSNADSDELDDELDGSFAVEQELMPLQETKEAINRAVMHGFNNTELNLAIDMGKFDDYFDSVTLAQFDTTKIDDSELQNGVLKIRQDANTELQRFHQDNLTALRNKFTTSMRDIHNRLVETLDHKDEGTTYGERYHEIEDDYQRLVQDVDRLVANETSKLMAQYQEDRENYGENAKREAFAVYDTRYRPELERKKTTIRASVPADLKTDRDVKLGALYDDRQTIAKRLFDKATTALLYTLQEEHREISRKELQMYDIFRKDLDVYTRKHYADEVLRAKAQAEKLRQSHEAESVRQQYEQMLNAKATQLQEENERGRNAVAQLEATHREQMAEVKADYDKRLAREKRDNEEIRNLLSDATENITKIGQQKEKEVEHQMKTLQDEIKAKKNELKYANERNARTQKPMFLAMAAAATITLMLGIIGGFLLGAGSADVAPVQQAQPAPADDTVSYHNAPSVEWFEIEYNDHAAA